MSKQHEHHEFSWTKIDVGAWECGCRKCKKSSPYSLVVEDEDWPVYAEVYQDNELVSSHIVIEASIPMPNELLFRAAITESVNSIVLGPEENMYIAARFKDMSGHWRVFHVEGDGCSYQISPPMSREDAMTCIECIRSEVQKSRSNKTKDD